MTTGPVLMYRTKKKFEHWACSTWYGSGSFTWGHFFLGIAIWNAGIMAFNVLFWPWALGPETAALHLKLTEVYWPTFACLGIAGFSSNTGLRAWSKALLLIGIIALVTWLLWNPQSEAWLNLVRSIELK